MRILIAGASGRTGRLLARLALERGHEVTALLRLTSRLDVSGERFTAVVGDVLEPGTLSAAVEGRDAVISLLAPRPRTNGRVYVEGTRNLADAAVRAGIRRFIAVSAEGAGADPGVLPATYRLVMRIPVVARLYPDIALMERELRARTDLDWTVVRPPILTDAGGGGAVREAVGPAVPGGLLLPRADLAAYLLDLAEKGLHVRESVAVAR